MNNICFGNYRKELSKPKNPAKALSCYYPVALREDTLDEFPANSAQFEPTFRSIYSRTQLGSRAFSSLDKASY